MKFIWLIFFSTCVLCQNNKTPLDSILTVSKKQGNDSAQVDYLNSVFMSYVYQRPKLAKQISLHAVRKSEILQNDYLLLRSWLRNGIYYDVVGDKDSAMIMYNQVLKKSQNNGDKLAEAYALNNIGLVQWDQQNLDQAMEAYLSAYQIFKHKNKKKGQANCLNNIGLVLMDLERYKDAISYHKKSLKIREELNDDYGKGAALTNLSRDYGYNNQPDSSIYYLRKAIYIKKKINDLRGLGIAYNNLGLTYEEGNRRDSCIFYLEKADAIYQQIDAVDKRAGNAMTLGKTYLKDNQYHKAIDCLQKSLSYLKNEDYYLKYEANYHLGEAYHKINDYKNSAYYYKQSLAVKDSISQNNEVVQTQEVFEKYNLAEKEKQILTQRAELAEQKLKIERKNLLLFIAIATLSLLGVIGYFIYQKQKSRNKQLVKENELKNALLKIEHQNHLQEQRLRISRDLHDNIGAQLTFIISSLDNLKYQFKIPEKLHNKLENIALFTTETITDLRDTIWAMNKTKISVEDLYARITNYIEKAGESIQDIQFDFTSNDIKNQNITFPSIVGMNIYRIVQEAVNNAIKHSRASQVELIFNKKSNQINITIKDNGTGFDCDKQTQGNGLQNMQKRTADINADLDIKSSSDGTTISLKLPV